MADPRDPKIIRVINEAIKNREKHKPLDDLCKSIMNYKEIPSTFDGEIPDISFGRTERPFEEGKYYRLSDKNGNEFEGILTHPVVLKIGIPIVAVGIFFRNMWLAEIRNQQGRCARCNKPLGNNSQKVNVSQGRYGDFLGINAKMCPKCAQITLMFSEPTAKFKIIFVTVFFLFLFFVSMVGIWSSNF